MTPQRNSLERALEEAVSRALRDNLAPLQRTADELHQAYADLVASCASTRPSNALPAMLRAQTAAAALAAGLSVLSNFVAVALNPRENEGAGGTAVAEPDQPAQEDAHEIVAELTPSAHIAEPEREVAPIPVLQEDEPEPAPGPVPEALREAAIAPDVLHNVQPEIELELDPVVPPAQVEPVEHIVEGFVEPPAAPAEAVFDIAALPPELQDLHRRANRVAKVAMQDIKLLRPKDVQTGREHKDICERLRVDLDKARKEYDRRFRAISDHPVDYFHHWMVDILAGGDPAALGEYPYPSPVLRH